MKTYLEKLASSEHFQAWNQGNKLFDHTNPKFIYHGTNQDFPFFLNYSMKEREERLESNNSKGGSAILGAFFSDSPRIAQNFAKEKWWVRNSRYMGGAHIRPCIVKLENPHYIYPIQATYFGRLYRAGQQHVYRDFLSRICKTYGHDGMVIYKEYDGAGWLAGTPLREINGTESEYSAEQICVFEPSFANVLQLNNLSLFI